MSFPKLRTINGAHLALKELDPSTAISASAIRRLVKSGQLQYGYSHRPAEASRELSGTGTEAGTDAGHPASCALIGR